METTFPFFPFVTEKDGKTCFNAKKNDFESERRAEHPFAGRNTQHKKDIFLIFGILLQIVDVTNKLNVFVHCNRQV